MSTERLYYDDAYLTEFGARVTACAQIGGRPAVALDRSAFYPEGGGQPADHGMLADRFVVDVQVEDGEVWHMLDHDGLGEGAAVSGRVDWARRFDHMQQHLGQHLLTAAFSAACNMPTVSFHLGAAVATIDLGTSALSVEQVAGAEELANRVVWEDRPVTARFVTAAELAALPLRKPPAVDGPVRVVSVPDFDYAACGGTHPRSTGGVGLIAVCGWTRQKGGVRVEFVCGGRALREFRHMNGIAMRTAAALSVGVDELEAAVERLRSAGEAQRKELTQLREVALIMEAEQLYATAETIGAARVVCREMAADAGDLRGLAQRIAARPGGVALLGAVGEKASLVAACAAESGLDARALLQAGLQVLQGRGGGTAALAQGGGPNVAELQAALAAMRAAAGRML